MEKETEEDGEEKEGWWDEVALAHHSTLARFVDMIGGAEYQRVKKGRVGSLRDTGILMCGELAPELGGEPGRGSRL